MKNISINNYVHSKWLLLLAVMPSIIGLFVEIIEPDGALYANIAKNIVLTGDFINLQVQSNDWLDKPHLPFWISAIFFKTLGISSFSYKLPAVLSTIMAGLYTFKTSKIYFSKEVSYVATLIFLSSFHITLSTIDVRAEAYLCFFTIAAFFHLEKFRLTGSYSQLLLSALFTAFCILTKGIFTIIPILSGQILYFLINKKRKNLFTWNWLIFGLIVFIGIIPELVSLYIQFDLHPEKIIFGKKNISGLKFFFWDSQFGRFFNTGPIIGSGEPLFYIHTLFWAFLPFSMMLIIAFFLGLKRIISINKITDRMIPFISAIITLILFSFSKFQLPHYTNILFSFFSIMVAELIVKEYVSYKFFNRSSFLIAVLMLFGMCVLLLYTHWSGTILISVILLLISLIILLQFTDSSNYIIGLKTGIVAVSMVTSILGAVIYPELFKYQAGMNAGMFLSTKEYSRIKKVYCIATNSYSFDFYCPKEIKYLNSLNEVKKGEVIIAYVERKWRDSIAFNKKKLQLKTIASFPYYRISMLSLSFLNPNSRMKETTFFDLLEISELKND